MLHNHGIYKAWYAGLDDTAGRIGYATSVDRLTWDRHQAPVLDRGNSGEGMTPRRTTRVFCWSGESIACDIPVMTVPHPGLDTQPWPTGSSGRSIQGILSSIWARKALGRKAKYSIPAHCLMGRPIASFPKTTRILSTRIQ